MNRQVSKNKFLKEQSTSDSTWMPLKWIFMLLMCFAHSFVQAQKQNNIWIFPPTTGLDFNGSFPIFVSSNISSTDEGCASVCDTGGALLFYTEGSYVWNRNNQLMPNASNLTGVPGILNGFLSATGSCTQGSVIVPMPDSASKYYVFSLTEFEETALYGRLYYSVVDMGLNGGLGDVVAGRKGILIDSVLTERMVGIQGDRCNIWLVVLSQQGVFKSYEITDAGINPTPVTSSYPQDAVYSSFGAGTLVVSPNRRKLALSNFILHSFDIFDFDPATGIVSNRQVLDSTDIGYSACFSPNSLTLYASLRNTIENYTASPIYQFDLSSGITATMAQSKTELSSTPYAAIRLAPNGKIYLGGANAIMAAINNPDVLGSGCNFTANIFNKIIDNDFPNPVPIFIRDTVKINNSQNVKGCFQNPVTLYANDSGWDYHWDNNTSVQTSLIVDSPGNYIVHYHTAPCAYHSDTFAVNYVSAIPSTGSSSACRGSHNGIAWVKPQPPDTITYTYTWTGPTGNILQTATSNVVADTLYNQEPGVYLVTLQGLNGCDTTLPVTINVNIIAPTIGSLSGCIGQHNGKAWVQPRQGDTTTYTYTWTDNFGELLQPATTSSIIADTLYNQYPGTYIVTMKGANGCDTSLPVTISQPSDSGFLHASDTGMCPHDTITINVTGGVSYHWKPDNRTYISDTSIANPSVSPPTDWSYIVYGSNASGCLDTTTAHVRVFSNAVIQLPDSVVLYYGESYQFNPGTNCLIFNWFPPLGLSADNISNPIASPPVDTKYIVTGTTEEGCTIKDSVNVYRSSEVVLTLPNAFTPGNGPNNLLKPIHEGDVTLDYLRVFNRWGQMVYESSSLDEGWDGMWHGTPQTESVFVYTMQGHTATGRILLKQGNVTLLR